MVSGFVTSPEDQSRICLLDASPIRMASKSLMSIKVLPWSLFLEFQFAFGQCRCLFFVAFRTDFDVAQVAEHLVVRQRHLAVDVNALLPFLGLLGCGLPRRCAERAR